MIPNLGEDGNMNESTAGIIERSWRAERRIGEGEFARDMDHADRMNLPVHRWSGEDRPGRPLTVVWVAGSRTGTLFSAYEISGGE